MANRTDLSRGLLFGLFALQNGMINQAALVAAFQVWTLAKDRPMAEILLEQGSLDGSDRALLESLVARHIRTHGGDPEASLAAVELGASTRKSLMKLSDPELDATLDRALSQSTEYGPADHTASYTVGSIAADGQRFQISPLTPRAASGPYSCAPTAS